MKYNSTEHFQSVLSRNNWKVFIFLTFVSLRLGNFYWNLEVREMSVSIFCSRQWRREIQGLNFNAKVLYWHEGGMCDYGEQVAYQIIRDGMKKVVRVFEIKRHYYENWRNRYIFLWQVPPNKSRTKEIYFLQHVDFHNPLKIKPFKGLKQTV